MTQNSLWWILNICCDWFDSVLTDTWTTPCSPSIWGEDWEIGIWDMMFGTSLDLDWGLTISMCNKTSKTIGLDSSYPDELLKAYLYSCLLLINCQKYVTGWLLTSFWSNFATKQKFYVCKASLPIFNVAFNSKYLKNASKKSYNHLHFYDGNIPENWYKTHGM